ncbi:hypothetical protein [Streptomyces subrutilus]|uniref:Uncharacterized protein n=1 Tax=Streptomyces subrutilus TaxID=36818 RepID=A0A1E5NXA2_9ACTN|nr:hypothetical protein [Streptomyces subrutilus]OEJ20879.1 hypothetical protein BGK67_35165 [Streptomyces subrutilus]
MSEDKPRTPADFRELLKEQYDLPEEAKTGKRRQRRQVKRAVKQARRATVKEVLEEERAKEPMNPLGALLIMALVFGIGFAANHFFNDDDRGGKAATVATSPSPLPSSAGGNGATASLSPSPSPSLSAAVDLSSPEKAAEGWAKVYLTRNPPVDEKHQAVVERSSPWMTAALTKNLLANDDKLWNNLISNGGISKVTAVEVAKADEALPVDTPLRVWRKITVKTAVDGYKQYEETTVLQAELTQGADGWRVARVLGV